MQLSLLVAFWTAAVSVEAALSSSPTQSQFSTTAKPPLSSSVTTQCYTRYTSIKPKSVAKVTWDASTTLMASLLKTITPVTTITPSAVTSTVTTSPLVLSFVTATTTTDTYTTSTTITTTTTDSTTEFYTQTQTSTSTQVVVSTTTVDVPAGFTALGSMPGYMPRRDVVAAAAAASPVAQYIPIIPPKPTKGSPKVNVLAAAGASTSAAQYPARIHCTRTTSFFFTKTKTRTASTSTTTAITPTVFSTSTISTTTTITVTPASATSIVTISSDTSTIYTTLTSSTTQTTTSTVTVQKASATYLAQCAQNNLVNQAIGQKIGTISFNPAFVLQSVYLNDDTGYACCATCAADPKCAGFAQGPSGTPCFYIQTDGRCDVSSSFGDRYRYYPTNGNGYIVGNAQCGFLGPQAGSQ